ncbi:MAG: hypothetical protein GF334_10100 [Candidatus Altiarchaeales archaeon]|nr:hypothetical protein [Candidatus Altiarchaeales archaeon]
MNHIKKVSNNIYTKKIVIWPGCQVSNAVYMINRFIEDMSQDDLWDQHRPTCIYKLANGDIYVVYETETTLVVRRGDTSKV